MKHKLLSLFVALIATTVLWAGNTITYTATAKLPYSTLDVGKTTFGPAITSHTFSNGTGVITCNGEITTIGEDAFCYYSGLTSVTIPNSVTTIGDYAFCDCSGLTSVTIPNSVTTIGEGAFCDCSGLTSVTIPNSVTTIGSLAFYGCVGLVSPVYNANCFAYMPPSYQGAYTIPDGIKQIAGRAFDGCSGLTSVTIPNSVTTIGSYAFYDCGGLTSVTIPNSVTTIGNSAFYECSGLTSVTIPNSVTTIGAGAFQKCSGLTSVTIPNFVTTIRNYAFDLVNNIVYSGTATGSPWGAKCVNGYVEGYLVYSDATKTKLCGCSSAATGAITIPNSVTTIGDYAFCDCSGLTSVTIPNSVTTIGSGAFQKCSGLTSVTIPNSVTTIGSDAFSGCSGLTSVTIPNSVTAIGSYAFYNCSRLNSITIGNSVTTIGNYVCDYCIVLTSVNIKAETPPIIGTSTWKGVASTCKWFVPCGTKSDYVSAWAMEDSKFTEKRFDISLTIESSEGGTVSNTAPLSCSNTTVNLVPIADYGYHFVQWSNGITNNPYRMIVSSDTTISAQFALNEYVLTVLPSDEQKGFVSGSGTYIHNTTATISATAYDGYHFVQWNDGSKTNPRQISVVQDASFTAMFTANIYTVVSSPSSNGIVTGAGTYDYLSTCTLTAIPNIGYEFVGWSDGNAINPRTLVITQDTIINANFRQQYQGKCGNNLYWKMEGNTLTITGDGAMYNFTENTMPWALFLNTINTIVFPNGITKVGAYAFYGCNGITTVSLPNSVTMIGEYAFASNSYLATVMLGSQMSFIDCNAFAGDRRLESITCYAPQTPNLCSSAFSGVSCNYVYLYVPEDNQRKYLVDSNWNIFDIRLIGAEEKPVTSDEVTVIPTDNQATFTWPVNNSADGYSLEITKDGVVFCTLKFNAQGQLTGIAFAPGRGGEQRTIPAAEMTTSGWQFTVTGLNQGSNYAYTLDALNASQQSIKHYEGEFTTTGTTGLEQLTIDNARCTMKKVIIDNQLFIFRGDKIYNAAGVEL